MVLLKEPLLDPNLEHTYRRAILGASPIVRRITVSFGNSTTVNELPEE